MMTELDILNGFASKVISDCIDISIKAIKKADKNRKSNNLNIQARIYQIIIDSLNYLTYNKYNGQDKLYDASERILEGFKNDKDNMDDIELGLKMLVTDEDDICQKFLGKLCHEICRFENSDLYKEIDMLWKRNESKYNHEEFRKSHQNDEKILGDLVEIKEDVICIKENMNSQEKYKIEQYEISTDNRAQYYAEKWDKNMFLNDFNKRDKNNCVSIKLRDIYLEEHLPHYIWKTNDEPFDDLKELLREYVVDNNDREMLLILGQPGIGKSTLITWMLANIVKKEDQILVYQFASDLKDVNWKDDDILKNIFKTIDLRYNTLGNNVLILDGFDEIHASSDREQILNKINQELKDMYVLEKFSLIITCRENYVKKSLLGGCDYITLQAWEEKQIKSFCEIYEKESAKENTEIKIRKISDTKINKIIENKEIFGIPLILYMLLALDVTIEKSSSIVEVYDHIFSLKGGGIYDRCIKNISYESPHRISKIKRKIHQISQRIAFWIFENNSEEAFISQKKFEEICKSIDKEIERDALIGNYFNLIHYEGIGTDEIQFIHRSIYEYFVAVYFFESIHNLKSKEEVAGKLGELLKDGCLSEQILEFIKYKFNSIKEYNLPGIIKDIFDIMLRDGMTYHIGEVISNVMSREMNVFSNMLKVVGLWNYGLGAFNDKIVSYLRYNYNEALNLIGIKLRKAYLFMANLCEANLRRADLSRALLTQANLSKADLSGANLSRADLIQANLSEANLSKADLSVASLIDADLSDANIRGADLSEADLSRANLSGAKLIGAKIIGVNLSRADLLGADLSVANLYAAYLEGADLSKTNLSQADLRGVKLNRVDLSEANLKGILVEEDQADYLYEKYDLVDSLVYLYETDEIISYKEYCNRKQRW